MGPFRWNVMTCYMLLVSTKSCVERNDGKVGPSYGSFYPIMELAPSALIYVAFFGLLIPSIGCLDPETLGRYFGGYRSLEGKWGPGLLRLMDGQGLVYVGVTYFTRGRSTCPARPADLVLFCFHVGFNLA